MSRNELSCNLRTVPASSQTVGTKFCTIFSAILYEIIIEYIPNSL
ncbi:hypothetical protein T11_1406 [Trichinella zimbabwensis]|uniref:Uncharacterized protein n=1 Tax=Trichinella zimbabwensis TaxID=268475 RepID=A0A0V1GM58_9BILA|nr:hypothetical protein T11_1406 [Trichinella zimbabwensis]